MFSTPHAITSRHESARESMEEYFARIERWEQKFAPFEFRLANWNTDTVVALVRESRRPAMTGWQAHGLTHEYIAFGTAFGDRRNQISCMRVACYHDQLPSALFVKDEHPELLACLEQYQPNELLQLARLASEHMTDGTYSFPPTLFAERQPINFCIPQRRLQSSVKTPLRVATVGIVQSSTEQYEHVKSLMQSLGSRSILIDLRSGPHTHKELQRRQHLKRNTYVWPRGDRAAQALHPIGLRATFGMKYKHLPDVVHFARTWYGSQTSKVWLYRPEQCSLLVELVTQGYPLVLVEGSDQVGAAYRPSLRRAIALHLLSLFSEQVEVIPEVAGEGFSASPMLLVRGEGSHDL